ncbi:putative aryl-alcohol dehydrogenase [Moniliophthora roreri]|uniref:NADP-dependent oxidoreductase domain-containing protein n=1 Tax=Moniliophthora roreri TaxID=221103 RepID=A0A0W0F5A6_MONRR|nr:putative aryl-alcohol dehydrogenase [Moniliophthora roreri]
MPSKSSSVRMTGKPTLIIYTVKKNPWKSSLENGLKREYTTLYKKSDPNIGQKVHYFGNNMKSLHLSVEASLRKLRTSYSDLLYVHWWDWDTSVEEVMDALHTLVLNCKVLYLGILDTSAWIISQANLYAKAYGKTPFVIYQGKWSVLDCSFE